MFEGVVRLVLAGLVVCGFAMQPVGAQVNLRALQQTLDTLVDRDHVPSIVVAWLAPEGTRLMRAGQISEQRPQKPGPDTLFEYGELTQIYTVAAFAQMVEQRKLTWNSKASTLLPAGLLEGLPGPLLLRHLASHSAGLPPVPLNLDPADPANPFLDYSEQALYEHLRFYSVSEPAVPGSRAEHSPMEIGLLGHLLSLRAGQTLEQVLHDTVLEPLNLKNTYAFLPMDKEDMLAPPHQGETPVPMWEYDVLAGSGALVGSARDALKFLRASTRGDRGPLSVALRRMQIPVLPADTDDTSFAYGWRATRHDSGPVFWISSLTGGSSGFMGVDPASGRGVVVLANGNWPLESVGFYMLKPEAYPLAPLPPLPEVSALRLQAHAGAYTTPSGEQITVRYKQPDKLYAQMPGAPEYRIYPVDSRRFVYAKGDVTLSFEGPPEQPSQAVLVQMGQKAVTAKRP